MSFVSLPKLSLGARCVTNDEHVVKFFNRRKRLIGTGNLGLRDKYNEGLIDYRTKYLSAAFIGPF